jgi:hypothetical protein
MIVDRGDIEATFDEFGHNRLDFGFEEDEIAHHHRLTAHCATAHSLERNPAAERQYRFDADIIEPHVEIGTGKTVAMNIAGHHRGLSADCFIDFLPVNFLTLRDTCRN